MNLTLSNLFHTHPAVAFDFAPHAFAILISLFVLSFMVSFYRKKVNDASAKKALRPLPSAMRWYAFVALVMTWSRLEGIPYLSMRIWWIVFAIAFAYTLWRTFSAFKLHKVTKEKFAGKVDENKKMKKYLPKKKKK